MCTRNIHNYKPRGLCGWTLLCCNYLPCAFACGLIFLNVLPFHAVFLPYLAERCGEGLASWHYYYYCFFMMVFAEVMVYGNFVLAAITAPGFVPHEPWSKAPAFDGKRYSDNPFAVRQLDRYGKMRYCSRCEQFKPDNAHHCNVSGRCVYQFDHFCPWINNAVGRNNSKYFLLFLSYIPVGAFHIVFMTAYSCTYHFKGITDFYYNTEAIDIYPGLVFFISILFSLCMGICFGAFAAHFLYMSYHGESSVSVYIARKAAESGHPGNTTTEGKASMIQHTVRENRLYDIFGADRRWWKMVCCFSPVRDERGLLDETMPTYTAAMQKLV